MIKVRFHLGKGIHFMHWQVKQADGRVEYYNPEAVTLYMRGCYLRNQRGTAEKIHDGANKTVCAWIEA